MPDIYEEKSRLFGQLAERVNPDTVQACADFIGRISGDIPLDAVVWERELWEHVLDEHVETYSENPTARAMTFRAALNTTPHMMGVFACLTTA